MSDPNQSATPSLESVVEMLRSLPSNRAREIAITRLLNRGLRAEVDAIARQVGFHKPPKVWGYAYVMHLARLVDRSRLPIRRKL